MLLDIFHGCAAALFSFFPVKDAGTGSDVAAHGRQTDFYVVIQHGKALFHMYWDGSFIVGLFVDLNNSGNPYICISKS